MIFLVQFYFTLSYQPGSQNGKADAFSMIHVQDIIAAECNIAPITWEIIHQIKEANGRNTTPNDTSSSKNDVPSEYKGLTMWVNRQK